MKKICLFLAFCFILGISVINSNGGDDFTGYLAPN